MSHMRKQIRDAVRTRLTGLPTAGARVYPSKRLSWVAAELPGLAIWTDTETVKETTMARDQKRDVVLIVDVAATASETLEDTLDQMCVEVEEAMAADPRLGGLVRDCALVGTGTDAATDGERHIGVKRLRYALTYDTSFGRPQG